jgi:hypothetical protein
VLDDHVIDLVSGWHWNEGRRQICKLRLIWRVLNLKRLLTWNKPKSLILKVLLLRNRIRSDIKDASWLFFSLVLLSLL